MAKKKKVVELTQIPGILFGPTALKDGSWTLRLEIPELLNDQYNALYYMNRKSGWFIFKTDELVDIDIINLPDEKPDFSDKTPSQRLRNCFYVLWEQKYQKKYPEFRDYYISQIERLIGLVKDKLD